MKSVLIALFFGSLLLQSCSKDEQIDNTSAPEITNSMDEINVDFYENGNELPLTVNWNNQQGHYALVSAHSEIKIDSTSGLLSWTKLVPLGENDVKIKVSNTRGSETITITLMNELKGEFTGTILYPGDDTGSYFDLTFDGSDKGSLAIFNTDNRAFGNWNELDGIFSGVYEFEPNDVVLMEGTLTYNETEVYMIGKHGYEIEDGDYFGNFRIDLKQQ